MQFPESRIIVFAKAPVEGKVKTRLIPAFGHKLATDLHTAMLWHILHELTTAEICPVQLWCAPDTDHPYFAQCAEVFSVSLHTQVGHDLGERMENAFVTVLDQAAHAVIVGADCPMIKAQDIRTALSHLQHTHQVVIAPAKDGGYVLLGLTDVHKKLFRNIPWGTSRVYEKTMYELDVGELDVHVLPEMWDVDHPTDVDELSRLKDQLGLHHRLSILLSSL